VPEQAARQHLKIRSAHSLYASRCLFSFHRFKESANITASKPSSSSAFDDLEKQCLPILAGSSEYLKKPTPFVMIHEYPEVLQFNELFPKATDSALELVVISGWYAQELDSVIA
jgi:hypothetical protein